MTEPKTDPMLERSISRMTAAITDILADREPSIYLYGSVVLGDFRLGWSDIDLLVLTKSSITEQQAERLVGLRQSMLEREPDNRCYRSFEGGMLSLDAFLSGAPDRVVYWGTSGQRITDRHHFDSFSMSELLTNGRLLRGDDVRSALKAPSFGELRRDIAYHYDTIRKYAQTTDRSLYSFGWLLDIARGVYTLRTGRVIAKTDAGVWALENRLCPDPDELALAVELRHDPSRFDDSMRDHAETLGGAVQRFADVLERELAEHTA